MTNSWPLLGCCSRSGRLGYCSRSGGLGYCSRSGRLGCCSRSGRGLLSGRIGAFLFGLGGWDGVFFIYTTVKQINKAKY